MTVIDITEDNSISKGSGRQAVSAPRHNRGNNMPARVNRGLAWSDGSFPLPPDESPTLRELFHLLRREVGFTRLTILVDSWDTERSIDLIDRILEYEEPSGGEFVFLLRSQGGPSGSLPAGLASREGVLVLDEKRRSHQIRLEHSSVNVLLFDGSRSVPTEELKGFADRTNVVLVEGAGPSSKDLVHALDGLSLTTLLCSRYSGKTWRCFVNEERGEDLVPCLTRHVQRMDRSLMEDGEHEQIAVDYQNWLRAAVAGGLETETAATAKSAVQRFLSARIGDERTERLLT